MAIITWPSALGSPRLDGFTFAQSDLVEKQESHRGAPRLRRRMIQRPVEVSMSFWWDAANAETFERFYWVNLQAGLNQTNMRVHTFYGPLLITLTVYPYSLRFNSVLAAAEVSFSATYNPPPVSLFAALVGE